jgi:hypothetical protein
LPSVENAPTTTSLTSSPNPSQFGQSVTFTATVTGSGTPTGTVTFKDGGKTLGTVFLSAGLASFSTSSLKKGTHLITAPYSGDGIFRVALLRLTLRWSTDLEAKPTEDNGPHRAVDAAIT